MSDLVRLNNNQNNNGLNPLIIFQCLVIVRVGWGQIENSVSLPRALHGYVYAENIKYH